MWQFCCLQWSITYFIGKKKIEIAINSKQFYFCEKSNYPIFRIHRDKQIMEWLRGAIEDKVVATLARAATMVTTTMMMMATVATAAKLAGTMASVATATASCRKSNGSDDDNENGMNMILAACKIWWSRIQPGLENMVAVMWNFIWNTVFDNQSWCQKSQNHGDFHLSQLLGGREGFPNGNISKRS